MFKAGDAVRINAPGWVTLAIAGAEQGDTGHIIGPVDNTSRVIMRVMVWRTGSERIIHRDWLEKLDEGR